MEIKVNFKGCLATCKPSHEISEAIKILTFLVSLILKSNL